MSDIAHRPAIIALRQRATTRQKIGAALLGSIVLFAIFGPWIAKVDPARQDLVRVVEAPSWAHPFGTDHLGRSMLARLAAAARLSLGLAFLCVVSAAIPGTALGILASWRGGWTERVLSVVSDSVLALPGLLLVLLLAALAPGAYWPLYLGLSLVLWVEYFRVVRATSATLLASPQVEASRLLGFGPLYIVRRHLAPELLPLITTLMTFGAATAVMSLGGLGFVGIGLRPPTPEWGVMMTELLPHYHEAPWLIAQPIIMLAMTVLGLAFLSGRDPR